eukprot:GHVN01031901.1.p1 GENE.GHVN01031901.1~~GHVN01031901.1.p1  ORF type:complete len:816 (+),score=233.29 GHVN01031901.1:79-2448(+)
MAGSLNSLELGERPCLSLGWLCLKATLPQKSESPTNSSPAATRLTSVIPARKLSVPTAVLEIVEAREVGLRGAVASFVVFMWRGSRYSTVPVALEVTDKRVVGGENDVSVVSEVIDGLKVTESGDGDDVTGSLRWQSRFPIRYDKEVEGGDDLVFRLYGERDDRSDTVLGFATMEIPKSLDEPYDTWLPLHQGSGGLRVRMTFLSPQSTTQLASEVVSYPVTQVVSVAGQVSQERHAMAGKDRRVLMSSTGLPVSVPVRGLRRVTKKDEREALSPTNVENTTSQSDKAKSISYLTDISHLTDTRHLTDISHLTDTSHLTQTEVSHLPETDISHLTRVNQTPSPMSVPVLREPSGWASSPFGLGSSPPLTHVTIPETSSPMVPPHAPVHRCHAEPAGTPTRGPTGIPTLRLNSLTQLPSLSWGKSGTCFLMPFNGGRSLPVHTERGLSIRDAHNRRTRVFVNPINPRCVENLERTSARRWESGGGVRSTLGWNEITDSRVQTDRGGYGRSFNNVDTNMEKINSYINVYSITRRMGDSSRESRGRQHDKAHNLNDVQMGDSNRSTHRLDSQPQSLHHQQCKAKTARGDWSSPLVPSARTSLLTHSPTSQCHSRTSPCHSPTSPRQPRPLAVSTSIRRPSLSATNPTAKRSSGHSQFQPGVYRIPPPPLTPGLGLNKYWVSSTGTRMTIDGCHSSDRRRGPQHVNNEKLRKYLVPLPLPLALTRAQRPSAEAVASLQTLPVGSRQNSLGESIRSAAAECYCQSAKCGCQQGLRNGCLPVSHRSEENWVKTHR